MRLLDATNRLTCLKIALLTQRVTERMVGMDGSTEVQGAKESFPRKILDTAQALSVDTVTAEVVTELASHGVRSILLKGPSFASWLYSDGSVRPYADVDLLIAPATVHAARGVLDELGFRPLFDSSDYFVRDLDAVDLHCSLKGIAARKEVLWETLSATAVPHEVAGAQVEALSIPARTFHVALHAAQHGPAWETPMEDLRRALDILPLATWQSAAALADELAATGAFATGLRLSPDGAAVAEQLHLAADVSVRTHLRATSRLTLHEASRRSVASKASGAESGSWCGSSSPRAPTCGSCLR